MLIDGHSAALGARAFDLLLALVERRDRTVTKNELLDLLWPGLLVEENNLQVQGSHRAPSSDGSQLSFLALMNLQAVQ